MKTQIILASRSKQRLLLLRQAGIHPQVVPADIEEEGGTTIKRPEKLAENNALKKAEKVSADFPDHPVLGADTITVSSTGRIMGKPENKQHAFEILSELSGTAHRVITGVAIVWKHRDIQKVIHEVTSVIMKPLTTQEIEQYLHTGEYIGKSGACSIKGKGAALVEKIEGSPQNVSGLPIERVKEELGRLNVW